MTEETKGIKFEFYYWGRPGYSGSVPPFDFKVQEDVIWFVFKFFRMSASSLTIESLRLPSGAYWVNRSLERHKVVEEFRVFVLNR